MRHASLFVLMSFILLPAALAAADDPIYTSLFGDLAVDGYDTVAYFEDGQPVKGKKEFSHEWMGATWRFASAGHLDLFKADPEKYAPQYGGYCSLAVARGDTASSDPKAWKIVDGKLYLNYSKKIKAEWEEDIDGNIVRADANWPKVLE